MLATLLIWFYTFFLCYVYGFLFLRLLQYFFNLEADPPSAALIVIAGLVILTTLASFVSLVLPIGRLITLVLLAGATGATISRRIPWPHIERPAGSLALALLFFAVLLVMENATHQATNPDTDLYHAQAIHWIESYPAVPGLGDLHGRLAYNSAWFVTNALFSLSFLGLRSFHLSGSVLFLAVLLYFWEGIWGSGSAPLKAVSLIKLLFLPIMVLLFETELSSPGTDLPASLLLWLVAVLWLEQQEHKRALHPVLMVLFAVFAVTVKLSTIPVLLLVGLLLVLGWMRGARRQSLGLALVAGIILLPFVLRNLILSGYLLYPFPAIDLFRFDWKVPYDQTLGEELSVQARARLPHVDTLRTLAMPFLQWFKRWLILQPVGRKLVFFSALGSLLAAVPALLGRVGSRIYWLGWLVYYLGIIFWLFNAPDFRFGYGFLIGAILMALVPWVELGLEHTRFFPARSSTAAALVVLLFLGFTFAGSYQPGSIAARLLFPTDYDQVPTQSCSLANATVFCAKAYGACSYDAFPCIPAARKWVEMRGPSLQDGFRAVP